MFELSLIELLFIAIAALIVIGPRDLPKALSAIVRAWRQVQSLVGEVRAGVNQIAEESGLEETRREMNTIIDQDGNVQQTYDISEFLESQDTSKTKILREKDLFDEDR